MGNGRKCNYFLMFPQNNPAHRELNYLGFSYGRVAHFPWHTPIKELIRAHNIANWIKCQILYPTLSPILNLATAKPHWEWKPEPRCRLFPRGRSVNLRHVVLWGCRLQCHNSAGSGGGALREMGQFHALLLWIEILKRGKLIHDKTDAGL